MHDPRLSRTIEDMYRDIGTIVEGRNYLISEVRAATADEGTNVMMAKLSIGLNNLLNIFSFN